MGLHHSPKIPTVGLLMYLDAKNTKSYPGTGTTWFDLTSYGNHATQLGNTSYVSHDPVVGCFDLTPVLADGTTAQDTEGTWWSVPHDTSLDPTVSENWTVSGFLKIDGSQSTNGVGWFHKTGAEERGIHLEPTGTTFRLNSTTGWSSPNIAVGSYSGIFTMYTFAFEQNDGVYGTGNGTVRCYINGEHVTENTAFIPSVDDGDAINLCRRKGHLTDFLRGSVATYQYYNRALSNAEIQQNYVAINQRFN